MNGKDNPLLEAYLNAKREEIIEKVSAWAQTCRYIYMAFRVEGFTDEQAMDLLKFWWLMLASQGEQGGSDDATNRHEGS